MGKDTTTSAKFAIVSACLSFVSVFLAVLAFGLPYWIHYDDVIAVSVSGTTNDVRMKFLYGFWRYCNDVSTSIQSFSSCGAVKTHTDLEQLTICLVMLSIILSINAFVNTCLYLCLMKNEKVCLYVTAVSAIISGLMMGVADINYGVQDHTAKITESYRLPFTVANLSTSFWLSMASCLIISTAALITVVALYYHNSESFSNNTSFISSENVKNVHEKSVIGDQTSVDGGSIYDKLYVQTNPSDPFHDDYFDNNASDDDEIKQPLVVDMVDTHPWNMEDTDMTEVSKKTNDNMNHNKHDIMKTNKEAVTDVWSHLEKDNTIYVSSDSESVSESDNEDHSVLRASKDSRLLNSVCDNISVQYKCTNLETEKDVQNVGCEFKCGTPAISHLNKPVSTGSEKLGIQYLERARSASYKHEQDLMLREHHNPSLTRPKPAPSTLTEDDKLLCDKMSRKSINLITNISSQANTSNVKDDRSVTESRRVLYQGNDDRSVTSGKSRSAWSEKGETHSTGRKPGVPGSCHSSFTTSDSATLQNSRIMSVRPCSAISHTERASRQVTEEMNYRNQLHTFSPSRSRPITPVHIDSMPMSENLDEETIDPPMGEGSNMISRPFLQELLDSMSMDSQISDVSADVMDPTDLKTNASPLFDMGNDKISKSVSQSKIPEDAMEKVENPEARKTAHQKGTDETAIVFNQERIKFNDEISKCKTFSRNEHSDTEKQVDFVKNGIAWDVQKSSIDFLQNTKTQTTHKRKKISIQFNVTPLIFPKESSVTTREQAKVESKPPILKVKRSESVRPKTPASNKTHPLGKPLQRQLTTLDENHPFARPGTAPKIAVSHIEPKEAKMLSKKDLVKKAAYKKLKQSYKCQVPRMYNIERQEVYRKLAKIQAESSAVKSTSKSSPTRMNASNPQQRRSPTRHGQSVIINTDANTLLQNSTVTHSEV